uniref:Uncharacterized protein n=1 Tax=Anguilla anguilla TaxID=7936 RepID=A0A0E9PGI4_ANGAN
MHFLHHSILSRLIVLIFQATHHLLISVGPLVK